jgi:hypothetical protein
MYKEQIIERNIANNNAVTRRGVGKASWRRTLMNIIESEQEDLEDLAILRNKLRNDPEALRILSEMSDRKTVRIVQLTQLLRYSEKAGGDGLVAA